MRVRPKKQLGNEKGLQATRLLTSINIGTITRIMDRKRNIAAKHIDSDLMKRIYALSFALKMVISLCTIWFETAMGQMRVLRR